MEDERKISIVLKETSSRRLSNSKASLSEAHSTIHYPSASSQPRSIESKSILKKISGASVENGKPESKQKRTVSLSKASQYDLSEAYRSPSIQKELTVRASLQGRPLFTTVTTSGSRPSKESASILIPDYGLRDLSSVQSALSITDKKILEEIYHDTLQSNTSDSGCRRESSLSIDEVKPWTHRKSIFLHGSTSSAIEVQTDEVPSDVIYKKRLTYLIGVPDTDRQALLMDKKAEPPFEEDYSGASKAMRHARKYLRVHKIFNFFQFLIAHLLCAVPANPIEFILAKLEECLMFRAGITEPPLLYSYTHLECLYKLMDKMGTGYIDLEQYKTGMRTLGICSTLREPQTTANNMIKKEDFIEDAYDSLSELLYDMVSKQYLRKTDRIIPDKIPSLQTMSSSSSSDEGALRFTRSRLFLKKSRTKSAAEAIKTHI